MSLEKQLDAALERLIATHMQVPRAVSQITALALMSMADTVKTPKDVVKMTARSGVFSEQVLYEYAGNTGQTITAAAIQILDHAEICEELADNVVQMANLKE